MKITPIVGPMPITPATTEPKRINVTTQATPDGVTTNQAIPPDSGKNDTVVENQAVTEETKPLSPQLAALAKQRRALQLQEQALKAREEALKNAQPTAATHIELAKLKERPLQVLLENGVTYDQLIEAVQANSGYNPEIVALKEEIKNLRSGVDKTLADRDAQAEQQVKAEMTREAEALVATGADFEMVRETKSIPDVIELIERTYREKGQLLDVREALRLVEEELISDAVKFSQLEKIRAKAAPPPPAQTQAQAPQMKTLSNRDGATQPMSRKARAIAAFNGTLGN